MSGHSREPSGGDPKGPLRTGTGRNRPWVGDRTSPPRSPWGRTGPFSQVVTEEKPSQISQGDGLTGSGGPRWVSFAFTGTHPA